MGRDEVQGFGAQPPGLAHALEAFGAVDRDQPLAGGNEIRAHVAHGSIPSFRMAVLHVPALPQSAISTGAATSIPVTDSVQP